MSRKYLIIDSRPYGLFSIFLHTVDCLKWCEENNYIPYIRWGSGRSDINLNRCGAQEASLIGLPSFVKDKNNFSTPKKRANNTRMCLYAEKENDNVWEYYFEPISELDIESVVGSEHEINDIFMCGQLDFDLENKFLIKNLHSYDALKIWNINDFENLQNHRNDVNKIIKKYVSIKTPISNKVENFYLNKFKNFDFCIGIHVRGTDKKTEYPFKQLSIQNYIEKIDEIIANNLNKKYKLYIASDNNESIIEIANKYGKENIICFPSTRMNSYSSSLPIHLSSDIDRKKHGEETLIEMLLLSKCDYIIGTDSNLTATACYYNPNAKLVYLDRKYGV